MATLPGAESGTVTFVADRACNLRWQPRPGRVVDVLAEAGEPFVVPADLADVFLATFGPRPESDASVSPAARGAGLIPGLRRA